MMSDNDGCVGEYCRNPLHAVAGCARFALEALNPNDETGMYEDLSTIVSSAIQMSNIITSIVEWTSAASAACDAGTDATLAPRDLHAACVETVPQTPLSLSSSIVVHRVHGIEAVITFSECIMASVSHVCVYERAGVNDLQSCGQGYQQLDLGVHGRERVSA